jgi:protocatechuate 3,4-dioxygenase beta subunit
MATVMVSGLLLGGVTYFTLAQDSTPAMVSGYVLDSSGYGIADAVIYF